MSDTPIEQAEQFFAERGLTAGFVVPTRTGLEKSLMDAHEGIRNWLRDTGLHDFAAQPKGPENKVVVRADVVFPTSRVEVGMSLYRPNTKGGDPRMWPGLLKVSGVQPGNLLALVKIRPDRVAIINMSNRPLLETVNVDGSPLRSVLEEAIREAGTGARPATVAAPGGGGAGGMANINGHGDASEHVQGRLAVLRSLWGLATGGGGVAAAPTDAPKGLPVAARGPGVEQAIKWLREDPDPTLSRVLFLTGGPGAGKSHATAEAVAGFSLEPGVDTRLAKRSYTYFGEAGRRFVVVNDATIGSGRDKGPVLDKEITDEVRRGSLMLVCVNRGVIVEELAHIRHMGYESAGSVMLEWLASDNTQTDRPTESGSGVYAVESLDATPYLRSAVLREHNQPVAEIVSVSVDACSLFEQTPGVARSLDGPGWFSTDEYRVTALLDRPDLDSSSTSAGELVEKVLDLLAAASPWEVPDGLMDPFTANIESLSQPSVRTGVLTLARASEVVSGTLFTFRDTWGLVVRAIVGAATDQTSSRNFLQLLDELQPSAKAPRDRFRQVQRLAGFRLTQAVFGVGADDPDVGQPDLKNPVALRLGLVDPVKDALAGELDSGSVETGWATPLMDAFSGLPASGSPLEALVKGRGIASSDGIHRIVTTFDERLDAEYRKVIEDPSLKDADRRSIKAWYGRYLTRLYAVGNGVPAFRREVEAWTQAWKLSATVPTILEKPLRTLIRPARSADDPGSLIPLLESRATPLVDAVVEPTLAVRMGSFGIATTRKGEQLLLHVTEEGHKSPPTLLDFALIRQALSCTAGWIGFTEASEATAPRLERFRSNQLTRRDGKQIVVLTAQNEFKLSLEDVQ